MISAGNAENLLVNPAKSSQYSDPENPFSETP
jgi:hypothetical protein